MERLVIDRCGSRTDVVYFDHDTIRQADCRRKAKNAARKREVRKRGLQTRLLRIGAVGAVMGWAWYLGLASPWFAGAIVTGCLMSAAYLCGAWRSSK